MATSKSTMRSIAALTTLSLLLHPLSVNGQARDQEALRGSHVHEASAHRIAVVGAGAGGSSAAYHLAKFYNGTSHEIPVELDVYEANPYVGGRSTTVDALDDPRYPTELGASIFVEVNQVLLNLTNEFRLSTRDATWEPTGSLYDLGIWDGKSFIFTMDNSDSDDGWFGRFKGYWDIAKLLWRYGLSPIRTKNTKDTVVGNFLKMYHEHFPIASLTNFATEVGLLEYTGVTGQEALLANGVSEEFAHDIIQSSTRVNYAQNLDQIHGLETMVCMAIEGAMSIDGGNWQIFNEAVKRSGAKLHLNTTVSDIWKTPEGTYKLESSLNNLGLDSIATKEYDTVILASPYQFSNITFTPPLSPQTTPPEIDYVTLHVTLFTSPHRPSPSFFGLTSQDEVPDSILTTLPSTSNSQNHHHRNNHHHEAIGSTTFWSLSTLRTLNPKTDPFPTSLSDIDLVHTSKLYPNHSSPRAQKQYIYKIFSPAPLTASFLNDLFAFNLSSSSIQEDEPITALPESLVPWSHVKVWQSYPYLPPKTEFAAQMLDSPYEGYADVFNVQTRVKADARDAVGVFYTSGIESFISTMETSALMGRNVAKVIVDGLSMALGKEAVQV